MTDISDLRVHLCTTLTSAEMLEPFGEVGTNYKNAAQQVSQTHFAEINNNKKVIPHDQTFYAHASQAFAQLGITLKTPLNVYLNVNFSKFCSR